MATIIPDNRKLSVYIYLFIYLYLFIAFLQSTQDIKRVISKRDGCVYLKQVPSIDGSLEPIE
jgi:hypothetical protein